MAVATSSCGGPGFSAAGDGGGPDALAEAAIDGSPSGDSAPVAAFCAGHPNALFCADFDEGTLAPPFESMLAMGGTLQLDTKDSHSAPASLLATTAAFSGGGPAAAWLQKDFGKRPDVLSCDFWIRIETESAKAEEVHLFGFVVSHTDGGAGTTQVHLDLHQDGAYAVSAYDGVSSPLNEQLSSMVQPQWQHFVLTLDLNATPYPILTIVEGTTTSPVMIPFAVAPGTLGIGLGIGDYGNTSGSTGWSARYDDVVCN